MRGTTRLIAALALSLCGAAGGCIAMPEAVERDFSPPDGKRPNNYHACPACARAAKEGKVLPLGGGGACVSR